jgi:O-antigen ligase
LSRAARSAVAVGATYFVARGSWVTTIGLSVATALLGTIWLTPTEGALDGQTTWRALAWLGLATGLAWCGGFGGSRSETVSSACNWSAWFRRHGLDIAVALVVAGHVLGGLLVLIAGGQKRHAANLLVEWLGLAAAWWVLRSLLRPREHRVAMAWPLMALVIAAAGLGIWQHAVSLPQAAAEWGPKIDRLREGLSRGDPDPKLIRDFAAAGIPTSEPGLTQFSKRLVHSQEPFGMFALANTFGGMLATGVCLLTVAWWKCRGGMSRPTWWLYGLMVGVVGWCVLLTKSRTALLALLLALLWWGWSLLRETPARGSIGRVAKWFVGGVAVVVLAGWGLIQLGVWDRWVISEAPKSLIYRLQYWTGGARLIAEAPWLGIGLGQFRGRYLQVKLPEASEQIADPHILWLDAWTNGGLLSVVGLLIGLVWFLDRLWRGDATESTEPGPFTSSRTTTRAVLGGVLLGGLGLFGYDVWRGGWDDRLLALLMIWGGLVAWGLRKPTWSQASAHPAGFLMASLALGLHLHGAGGFQMPGVMAWWLVLLGWLVPTEPTDDAPTTTTQATRFGHGWMRSWGPGLMTTAGLGVGLWLVVPDWRCQAALADAARWIAAGRWAESERALERATEFDPWNPAPWSQWGELLAGPSPSHEEPVTDRMMRGQRMFAEAEQRDPANPRYALRQGELLSGLTSTDQSLKSEMLAHLKRAHALSPTDNEILWRLANQARQVGEYALAREAAAAALKQDDLNREWWHEDRILPDDRRAALERIVAGERDGS